MKTYDLRNSVGTVVAVVLAGCLAGGCGGGDDTTANSNAAVMVKRTPGAKAPAPIVASFKPEAGAPGTKVTITGEKFRTATSVKFNGANAGFTVVSATQIRATVPSAATTGKITVASGDEFGNSPKDFTVEPRPATPAATTAATAAATASTTPVTAATTPVTTPVITPAP